MKTLFYQNNNVVIEELPAPQCGSKEVLVANAYSVISIGSEIFSISESSTSAKIGKKENIEKIFENLKKKGIFQTTRMVINALRSERPLGYSSAGYVIDKGKDVLDLKIGDMVACMGMDKAVHGEIIAVPRNLVAKLPDRFNDLRLAAFGTIGAIALNAVRRLNPQIGENVIIFGIGLIGLMTLLIVKITGAKTICFDLDEERLKKAEELGADFVFNIKDENAAKQINYLTSGQGADSIIMAAASENPEIINTALEFLKSNGKIVLLGKVPINIDYSLAFKKNINFLISQSYGPGRYDIKYEEQGIDYPFEYVRWTENRNLETILDLIAKGKLNVKELISQEISLEQAPELYEQLKQGKDKKLGVLISYEPEKFIQKTKKLDNKIIVCDKSPKISEKLQVGIVGIGDFAKGMLLPILSDLRNLYEIRAIVSSKPYNLKQIARNYKINYIATNIEEILNDKDIDLVFITTPHNTHKDLILKCLEKNKPCFVEKPLCINLEEYQELEEIFIKNNKSPIPLFVGFNRRYAPLIIKAQEFLNSLSGPAIINYTINAGYMDSDNWMHNPKIGGGRLISEVCHFIDLGVFFTKSEVQKHYTDFIRPNNRNIKNLDNYLINLKFEDQSLMNINYNSIGSPYAPKEYIQIFKQGFILELIDFKILKIYSNKNLKEIKLKYIDKGHKKQYEEIAKFLKGESNIVSSLFDAFNSTKITLELNEKIYGNERYIIGD